MEKNPKRSFSTDIESTRALFRMNTGQVELSEEQRRVLQAAAARVIRQHPPKHRR